MSTFTTPMTVNDARSWRILVRCRLTPRLKRAWLGCRAAVREDFKARDSWLWQPEAEWRRWAPAKLVLHRYTSPVSLLVSITFFFKRPLLCAFFSIAFLSCIFVACLVQVPSSAYLHTSVVPASCLTKFTPKDLCCTSLQ